MSLRWGDLAIAAALSLLAGGAALYLPNGSTIRLLLTLPILFFLPGYLLIQSFDADRDRTPTPVQGVAAIGLSPAIVGVLALATALIPGGFREVSIIATTTLGCLALAGIATRHRYLSAVARSKAGVASRAPSATSSVDEGRPLPETDDDPHQDPEIDRGPVPRDQSPHPVPSE